MSKTASFVSAVLIGGILLAGCGGGSDDGASASVASEFSAAATPAFRRTPVAVRNSGLTEADVRKIKASALHNGFVRQVATGSHVRVSKVVPWVSEGGAELLGGAVYVYLSPPVRLVDQRLPAIISPNQKAPPGTPTLYRYVRMSATDVGELEVQIELDSRRAVRIEPAGEGYEITKLELIGPAPKSSAYAPEPGY